MLFYRDLHAGKPELFDNHFEAGVHFSWFATWPRNFQEELVMKPCPFCGSDDVGYSYREHSDGRKLSFIACGNCGASGPARTYLSLADDDESEAALDMRHNARA